MGRPGCIPASSAPRHSGRALAAMSVHVTTIAVGVLFLVCRAVQVEGAEEHRPTDVKRFDALSGRITILGHENIHDWKAEGTMIAGFLEALPGFPSAPKDSRERVVTRAEVFIPVRNLKAVGESWEPYNEQRTTMIQKKLHAEEHPKISFRLTEFHAAGVPSSAPASYHFDSAGELVIAGVTNRVSMPLQIVPLTGAKLKISGRTNLKQSDFNIAPKPKPAFEPWDSDTVDIAFEWIVVQKGAR
jgi:hypothetical protein